MSHILEYKETSDAVMVQFSLSLCAFCLIMLFVFDLDL